MSIQYTADQLQRKFQGAPGAGGFARIAEVLREEGRHEEAVALCLEGLQARPGHLTGLLVLGKVYLDMDKLEEAREQFEAALRQDPRCLSAMHLLARIMVRMQWQDAAAAYYRSILELEPWDTETLARLRDLSPSGAPMAGFASTQEDETGTLASPPAEPAVEQFDLDHAADFVPAEPSPGELAGALEELSLEDALSEPPGPAVTAAPLPPTSSELAEPRPMDILPSTPVPESPDEFNEPAPISGDDIGDRLDSLFGVQDDKPVLKAGPAPQAPNSGDAALESGDATMQLPAFAAETAHAAPAPNPADLLPDEGPAPLDLKISGEPVDLAPEERVSGEDIEDRLDALFSLTEGTRTQPALPPVPAEEPAAAEASSGDTPEATAFSPWNAEAPASETVFAAMPETVPEIDAPAAEPATSESPAFGEQAPAFGEQAPVTGEGEAGAPAAEDFLAAAAVSDVAERPAFLGDRPALGPFSAGPADVADAPPEDVILSAGPDAASTAIDPDEVVTGQDVADKLDALFGEPAPRGEPLRKTPADTGIFPPPDDLPQGTASWAAARPAEEIPGASDTQSGIAPGQDLPLEDLTATPAETTIASSEDYSPARWDEAPGTEEASATDLLTTQNMLPRGIGRDSAPPVTGEDIEDRLDSLFNLDEPGGSPMPAAEAPYVHDEAPSPDVQAPAEADRAQAGDAAAPDAPERTMILPAMRENPADWLARQSGETLIPGAGEVLAAEPDAPSALSPAASGADTVGLEMVDGGDIENRLEQIFSPEEEAGRAARAAAESAIARGDATLEGEPLLPEIEAPAMETGERPLPIDEDSILAQESPAPSAGDETVESPIAGTMVSGDDIKNRLSEIFEDGPRVAEPRSGDAFAAGSLPEPQEPAWEVLPEPDGLGTDLAGMERVPETAPEAIPDAGLQFEPEAEPTENPLPFPEEDASEGPESSGLPASAAAAMAARTSAAPLSPLQDEEEGDLEEEENSPQSAAGANVATVTLAEIYFQQGLREQALQIYRQLLEREPGNESVRKRIQDIEASKPEAGPGPGADPRRPRPGLKVPKRKK